MLVAGRNSPLRQSGNHAQMGLISAKVHLREMTETLEGHPPIYTYWLTYLISRKFSNFGNFHFPS